MAATRLPRLVGVVGAGQLGSGIAQVCAVKGQDVILCDTNKDALERSLNGIEKRLESNVRKDRMSSRDASGLQVRWRSVWQAWRYVGSLLAEIVTAVVVR